MEKKVIISIIITLLVGILPATAAMPATSTLKQQMDYLHRRDGLNFVYEATVPVNQPYKGPSLQKLKTQDALQTLFKGSHISWKLNGTYVVLHYKNDTKTTTTPPKQQTQKQQRLFTVSGYVTDQDGETLLNATIKDTATGAGTMTNSYGFYSLTLPEGSHSLHVSYIGFDDHTASIKLDANKTMNISLKENTTLAGVVVTGDLNSPLLTTQTGKRSLTQNDLRKGYNLLSSPDIVKTLQRVSGVAEGVELASGLYVHGGNNDENLFLIDGTPLYQVNHTLGLFSSFNADVVKNVDFYKSGFPARYGGRLSSVVDVRTNDGDMQHTHGSYRIGLLDGSFQLEGPIRRGRTSYNIGLRRSWLDIITKPAFAIANHKKKEEKISIDYFFHDLNAKVTHVFNERSRAYLSIYSGADALTSKDNDTWGSTPTNKSLDIYETKFSWGNFNAALNWNYLFSPKLFANFTAIYTHNRARLASTEDDKSYTGDKLTNITHLEHGYRSTINDLGYRAAFDFRPTPRHHLRFGTDYTLHGFSPQTRTTFNFYGEQERGDTIRTSSKNRHTAHEFNVYAEDEFRLNGMLTFNAGANLSFFSIGRKKFFRLDPRAAMKLQINDDMSLKASYTMMTQFVHKISNSYLDLPTDYWVPTTERLRPMHSQQATLGFYTRPGRHWLLSLEGYYKWTKNIIQYSSWIGLEPPAESWDKNVMVGQGRYYGAELDARYQTSKLTLEGSYTLSWNKRKYEEFYPEWYFDKFDNRHKINLSAQLHLGKKVQLYAAWTYHTGNRMTLPTQYAYTPNVPDGRNIYPTPEFFYEKPNNISLPAYHRLDVGCDFHHTTKHGKERIWNISLYNAYCHLNPIYVSVKVRDNGQFRTKTHGYIPIIPSCSYTIRF